MKMFLAVFCVIALSACVEKKTQSVPDAGTVVPEAPVVGAGTNMVGPATPSVVVKPTEVAPVPVVPAAATEQVAPSAEVKPAEVVPAPVQAEPVTK